MALNDILAADLAYAASEMPSSLVYSGVTVTGSAGSVVKRDDVQPDGILNEAELEWHGKVADFTTVPGVRDSVTVDGIIYYVVQREVDAAGVGVVLWLRRV